MDLNEILDRGVANIIPSKEELKKALQNGKKLNIYLGIDPTASRIHLGHAVPLRKIAQFAKAGHNVTFLIGDFTALIGDTSDKDAERVALTEEEINNNFKDYKKLAEKVIDFSKIKVRRNSEWLKELNYKKILELTMQFSLGDFISRELIKKRLTQEKRVGLHEVLYPVMQGYDSYMLETDIQVGGTDQTFNMQAGRTLNKNWRKRESYVLSTPILEGSDGKKMSKTSGNVIWLDDTSEDMYRKVMAISDSLIIDYYTLATSVPLSEIEKIKEDVKENPMTVKKKLAFEIVKELVSEEEARKAQESFERTVQQKETPTDIKTFSLSPEETVSEILINVGFANSKSEAKRLVDQKGVTIDGTLIDEENQKINLSKEKLLKVGKTKFAKIISK